MVRGIKNYKTVGEIYDYKDNLFDFLRLFFAFMVIYHHSVVIYYGKNHPLDFISIFTNQYDSFGSVAVGGFFAISGFLITQSWLSTNSYFKYLIKRLLRIMPALIVSVLVSAIIIGPIFTNLPLRAYFALSGDNAPISYIFHSLTFGVARIGYRIRDLFSGNPYPFTVNGSVWTLKHEFFWYLMVPFLMIFSKKNKKYLFLPLIFFTALVVGYYFYSYRLFKPSFFWFFGKEYSVFIKLAIQFLIGAIFYAYKDKIVVNSEKVLILISLFLLSFFFNLSYFAFIFIFPILVLYLGIMIKGINIKKYGDFSYGLYIYSFPLQQVLISIFPRSNIFSYLFLVITSTLFVSVLSWKFIEKPAISLKKKIPELVNFSLNKSKDFAKIK